MRNVRLVLYLVFQAALSAVVVFAVGCGESRLELAFSIGLSLMNPDIEWTPEMAEALEVPTTVRTKDQAIEHFMLFVAENVGEPNAAYYLLGTHFLDLDCPKAERYLTLATETMDAQPERSRKLLKRVVEMGCADAFDWLVQEMAPTEPVNDIETL